MERPAVGGEGPLAARHRQLGEAVLRARVVRRVRLQRERVVVARPHDIAARLPRALGEAARAREEIVHRQPTSRLARVRRARHAQHLMQRRLPHGRRGRTHDACFSCFSWEPPSACLDTTCSPSLQGTLAVAAHQPLASAACRLAGWPATGDRCPSPS
eukprot:scaffold42462_cov58-Phaeocystis_antarctica.AAC.5